MTRMKRRLIIISIFVFLILIIVVQFFYRPTRLALERAESFQFRRMLVTKLNDRDEYRFFFITNRNLEDGEGPIEEQFGNRRETTLNSDYSIRLSNRRWESAC